MRLPALLIASAFLTLPLRPGHAADILGELAATPTAAPSPQPTPPPETLEVVVRRGDTLSAIFRRSGLKTSAHRVVRSSKAARRLTALQPGDVLRILARRGIMERLEYDPDPLRRLVVHRNGEQYTAQWERRPVETQTLVANGTITRSLFRDGRDAGLPDSILVDLTRLLRWDIDFSRDLRAGDSFTVVYQEHRRDDRKLASGPILAVEFINRGRVHRAFRYTTSRGETAYFTEKGEPLRKQFSRNPVDAARISSRFSLRRWHPVLHRFRAHKGVDYAAPRGTPVHATADGTVVHKGRKGGYGNTVILKHGKHHTTLYAHLSRYAKGLKVGKRVRQGEVIGYVGSSGLATGPHLHYEFRVDGRHKDPLKVAARRADPLPPSELRRFREHIQPMLAELDTHRRVRLAQSGD